MGASIGPRIELENEDGYIRSLKTVTAETKAYASGWKELQSSFGKDTSAWEKSQKSAAYLTDEISVQQEKIRLLNEELEKVEPNSTKAFDIQDKINKAKTALNQMNNELKELPNHLQAIGEDWEALGDKFQSAGKSVSKVGDTLTKATAPITAGIGLSIKTVADYESAMDKAWSVTGALDSSLTDLEKQTVFEQLSAKAREMGEATKFTASEAADAIYYMGLAGWDADAVMSGLSGVMNLAAASGEDLARTSDIVTDSLTAFGQSAEMSDHFADVMAATMANSNTTVDLLGESFKYVGAVAGSFGYSIDDVALGLGLMANAGVKGSQAGTGLRQAIQKLTDPTDKTAGVMEKYGVSLFDTEGKALSFAEVIQSLRGKFGGVNVDIQEMASILENDGEEALDSYTNSLNLTMTDQEKLTAIVQMFGTRALPGVLAMIDASEEDYNKLATAIQTSSDAVEVNGEMFEGAAAAMAAVQLDNFTGQMTILKSKLQELAISFGEQMLPTLMKLVDGAQKFVDGLNGMSDGTKEAILKIGLFVAAVGPVLSIGGRFISGIGTLVSGGGKLLQLIGGIAGGASSVASAAGTVAGAAGGVTSAITGGGGLIAGLGSLAAAVGPFLAGGAVIAGIGIAAYEIYKHWDDIKAAAAKLGDWVSEKWNTLKENTAEAWGNIKEKVGSAWETLKKNTVEGMENVKEKYKSGWEHIKNNTIEAMENVKEKYKTGWEHIKNNTVQAMENVKEKYKSAWEKIKTNTADAMENVKGKYQSAFENLKSTTEGKLHEISSQWNDTFHSLIDKATSWGKDMMHNLSDGISSGIGWVKEKVSGAAQAIKNFLGFSEPSEGPLSDFHTYAPDMMHLFADGIGDNAGAVTGELNNLGDMMRGVFGGMKSDGWNSGVGVSENLGGGIENAMGKAVNAADSMKSRVSSALSGIASSAHSWGSDLAGNMANGIRSAMGRAVDAASSLASKLSSYLHFSEPDVGPLSDFHTWMPDMMKQLADGIYSNMGRVDRAMNSLAERMVLPAMEMSLPERSEQKATTITNGDLVVNVYGTEGMDVRELARAVEQEISFHMNRRSAVIA